MDNSQQKDGQKTQDDHYSYEKKLPVKKFRNYVPGKRKPIPARREEEED